jgi:signal transduction histidine kinase
MRWHNIINAGIDENVPFVVQRSVRAMNIIGLSLSPVSIIIGGLIVIYYPYNPFAFSASTIVAIALAIIPLINSQKLHTLSRCIWTLSLCSSIILHIWLYGDGIGLEFGFLAVQTSLFVFCGSTKEINFHTAFLVVALLASSYVSYVQGKSENIIVYNTIAVSCMGAIYLNLIVLRSENAQYENKISQQNHELYAQAKELSEQNNEIQALAEEIQAQSDQLRLKNDALEEKNIYLEEVNREKDGLIAIVAHDLRAPFNRVKGLVALLNSNLSTEEKHEVFNKLSNSTAEGLALIKDILYLNAVEGEADASENTMINVRSLIKEFLQPLQESAKSKNIDLCLTIDGDPQLFTSAISLKRILDNLITNAIKFSNPGSVVLVTVKESNDILRISVRDNGPGFTPEDQKRLFKKFQRLSAKPTAGETSNGLGLAIVKLLVDQLSGNISLDSTPGQGTQFNILLKCHSEYERNILK